MDGSTASLIAIPIVVALSLAAWLLAVAYAAAHPQWKHGTAAAGADRPASAHLQAPTAEPRADDPASTDTGQPAIPAPPAKLAA